jgi:hypothetical protein
MVIYFEPKRNWPFVFAVCISVLSALGVLYNTSNPIAALILLLPTLFSVLVIANHNKMEGVEVEVSE